MLEKTQKIHKFEYSGLGKAPYRCVGVFELPSPSLAEHNPEAYNNQLKMMPPGFKCGTCSYCGMALKYNYLIVGSDGYKFSVGSECVRKVGDAGLMKTVTKEEAERRRIKNAERREKRRQERLQAQRDANGGLTDQELWQKKQAEKDAKLKALRDKRAKILAPLGDELKDGRGGFCDDVGAGLSRGSLPRGRGWDLVCDILAKKSGRRNSKAYDARFHEVEDLLCRAEKIQ